MLTICKDSKHCKLRNKCFHYIEHEITIIDNKPSCLIEENDYWYMDNKEKKYNIKRLI